MLLAIPQSSHLTMLRNMMCSKVNCTCSQHQFLDCLKRKENEKAKLLLQKLDNLCELIDSSGRTLLHYSVECGNAEITQYLIDQGCDVNVQANYFGDTPLLLAVKFIDLETAVILVKNNANIYMTNYDGICSFQLAFNCYCESFDIGRPKLRLILVMLVDKVNKDFLEGRLTNFLLNASDEVKLVLVSFASVEIVKFILDSGYAIDFHEPGRGCTALHCAIRLGSFKNAKILIEHGANVDATDNSDSSPLYYYVNNFQDVDENSAVLKMLLRRSSQLSPVDDGSFTDAERLLMLGNENTVKTVLLSDIDVNAYKHQNKSLVHLLIENESLDDLDFLAELDVELDLNQRNWTGKTALISAVKFGCPNKVEFLLRHGADVNMTAPDGTSALFWAILHYSENEDDDQEEILEEMIELLLHYGADAQSVIINSDHSFMRKFFVTDKLVAAHLAMIEASLTDSSRNVIQSNPQWKTHFDLCLQQLDRLKHFTVHGTVTLFKLLTERQDKITAYARNQELLSEWSSSMENLPQLEYYYVNTLENRLSEGRETAKLQEKAALAIAELTGLSTDVYHAIVYKIISYLNLRDLRNLGQIESIIQ